MTIERQHCNVTYAEMFDHLMINMTEEQLKEALDMLGKPTVDFRIDAWDYFLKLVVSYVIHHKEQAKPVVDYFYNDAAIYPDEREEVMREELIKVFLERRPNVKEIYDFGRYSFASPACLYEEAYEQGIISTWEHYEQLEHLCMHGDDPGHELEMLCAGFDDTDMYRKHGKDDEEIWDNLYLPWIQDKEGHT